MYWNSDDSFPLAKNDWGAWRPPLGRRIQGESAVRRAAKQWHPLDPLLVSLPGSERMLPPICYPELAAALQSRTTIQYTSLLILIAVMAGGFAVAGLTLKDQFFLRAGVAMVLLFAFVLLQQWCIFRKSDRLRSYSRFVSWCYLQPRDSVVSLGLLMTVIGVIQVFLQARAGSLGELIEEYGLVFQKASAEPWRYLVGPFLHGGAPHWVANFSLLIVAAGLCFALGRRGPLWAIFLVGVLVPSFALAFLPHWMGRDAFVGISGGVFALYGWTIGVAYANRRAFPYGLWWVIGYFASATALIATLLDPRASWFVHVLGFAIGLVAGISGIGYKLKTGLPKQV